MNNHEIETLPIHVAKISRFKLVLAHYKDDVYQMIQNNPSEQSFTSCEEHEHKFISNRHKFC